MPGLGGVLYFSKRITAHAAQCALLIDALPSAGYGLEAGYSWVIGAWVLGCGAVAWGYLV